MPLTMGSRYTILVVLVSATLAALFLHRMPQAPEYHLFADVRTCFGIPNFFNVLSNAAFAFVGAAVLMWLCRKRNMPRDQFVDRGEIALFAALYVSAFFISFGSAYYHWAPDNPRLFWDRLPMSLTAAAFVAIVVADRFGSRIGLRVYMSIAAVSVAALIYWRATMVPGPDNVWPYFVTLYGSLLNAVAVMALFKSRYTGALRVWAAVALFVVSMAFDARLDAPLFALGQVISGHTLKHLLAAIALSVLAWGLCTRRNH